MVVDLIKGGDKQPSAGRAALGHKSFQFFFFFFFVLCNRASTHTSSTGGFPGGNNYVSSTVP